MGTRGSGYCRGSLSGVERVVVRDANLRMLSAFGVGTCLSDKCLIVGKDSVLKNVKRFEIGENSLPRVDRVTGRSCWIGKFGDWCQQREWNRN